MCLKLYVIKLFTAHFYTKLHNSENKKDFKLIENIHFEHN